MMAWWEMFLLAFPWSLVAVAAETVPEAPMLYDCNQTSIHLVIRMEPWGAGISLDPQYLHLGSCSPSNVDYKQSLLYFQYSFKECGFARLISGEMVEYSTNLVYRPPSNLAQLYNGHFAERINCTNYEARGAIPTLASLVTGQLSASAGLIFTGQLMNEDFSAPSDSTIFLLGSQIYIELAVQNLLHQPLQIFVDECTAAPSPELSRSARNYSVITNHGCLVDGVVANSKFLPRGAPEVIRFTLQAFEFTGIASDIYLHCQILVWDPDVLTDPTRKACSFLKEANRWELLDDPSSQLCGCCDSVCQTPASRYRRELEGSSRKVSPQQSTVVVGRFTVHKPAERAGSYEWKANGSVAVRSHKGWKQDVMPPAVGALLLEVAVIAVLSFGFCFYNGYQKRLCLRNGQGGDPMARGLLDAEQDCGSINADVEYVQ